MVRAVNLTSPPACVFTQVSRIWITHTTGQDGILCRQLTKPNHPSGCTGEFLGLRTLG